MRRTKDEKSIGVARKKALPCREDLTTGLLDDVSVPKGNLAKPLLIALGALLASGILHKGALADSTGAPAMPLDRTEGAVLGGLLQRFQQNGHGDVINSRIGLGQNQVISTRLGPWVRYHQRPGGATWPVGTGANDAAVKGFTRCRPQTDAQRAAAH